jgi:LysM repeat protein
VHLTRRGRALAVLVFAAVLLGAFSLGRTASQAAAPTSPVLTTTVEQTTVEPGDSLWSVAQRVAPDNDPREVVEQIRRLNDLPSAHIRAGQQLLLPVAA